MEDDAIKTELGRLERCCDFASEWQITAAGFWANMQFWLGAAAAALAGVSSGTAFSNQSVLAGSLAAAAAITAAVLAALRPAERAELHQQAAAKYHGLAVRARLLRTFGDAGALPASGDSLRDLEAGVLKVDSESPWAPRRLASKTQTFLSDGLRYYDNEGAVHRPSRRRRWLRWIGRNQEEQSRRRSTASSDGPEE